MKKVVVIGGGHGQSTILRGIKNIEGIEITAIVTVADNGGSTGRIRSLYHIPAMGDIRSVMIALAGSESIMKELMDYRFDVEGRNDDVSGHNLGNLILTAMTDMSGSFVDAIARASEILNVNGDIIPSTLDVVQLYAIMDDGTLVKGEENIPNFNHHIKEVLYQDEVKANPEAVTKILEADLIIYGIGSIYTSILPNIIIPGIRDALNQSKAKKVYFANCMTQNNETFDYTLKDHVDAIEASGSKIDLVVKHKENIPFYVRNKYIKNNSIEVVDKGDVNHHILERELLDFSNDLVRHDPQKISSVIKEILEEL